MKGTFPGKSASASGRARGPAAAVAAACLMLAAAGPAAAQAQNRGSSARDGGGANTKVYRCTAGKTAVFTDSVAVCPDAVAPSEPKERAPQTRRLTRPGTPCPLLVPSPEGAMWAEVRACYSEYLSALPDHSGAEGQLAGAAMGLCDTQTKALATGTTYTAELGVSPFDRLEVIRRWARWLVRGMGKANDATPMEAVRTGGAGAQLRYISAPLDLQLPDGNVVEARSGATLAPGAQLYLRHGVSAVIGAASFVASDLDRCVMVQ